MKKKSRIEIVTETEREVSFRVERTAARSVFGQPCGECGGELMSVNEAARQSALGWREITHLIESGALHSIETASGEIYVCAASISKRR